MVVKHTCTKKKEKKLNQFAKILILQIFVRYNGCLHSLYKIVEVSFSWLKPSLVVLG